MLRVIFTDTYFYVKCKMRKQFCGVDVFVKSTLRISRGRHSYLFYEEHIGKKTYVIGPGYKRYTLIKSYREYLASFNFLCACNKKYKI